METIEKIDIKKMKEDIKVKVEEQRSYKDARKNAHVVYDKGQPYWDPMSPREAQWKHMANRKNLRLMYAAYGLSRGKKFSQIENHYPEENHPLNEWRVSIDGIINRYKIMVEVEEKGV